MRQNQSSDETPDRGFNSVPSTGKSPQFDPIVFQTKRILRPSSRDQLNNPSDEEVVDDRNNNNNNNNNNNQSKLTCGCSFVNKSNENCCKENDQQFHPIHAKNNQSSFENKSLNEIHCSNLELFSSEQMNEDRKPAKKSDMTPHEQHEEDSSPRNFTNVKLAAIDGTGVAVAQFSREEQSTTPPADANHPYQPPQSMEVFNAVLWNLQQQQLYQMQMLHKLHRQFDTRTEEQDSNIDVERVKGQDILRAEQPIEHNSIKTENKTFDVATKSSTSTRESEPKQTTEKAQSPSSKYLNCDPTSTSSGYYKPLTPSTSSFISPMLAMIDMSSTRLLQQKILQDSKLSIFHVFIFFETKS